MFGFSINAVWMFFFKFKKQFTILFRNTFNCLSHFFAFCIFFFPFVFILDINNFSLFICTMHWTLCFVQCFEILHNDFGYAIDKSDFSYIFQIGKLQLNRFYEIHNVHGIFTRFVQKEIQIKRLVRICRIVCCIVCTIFNHFHHNILKFRCLFGLFHNQMFEL